MALASKIAKLYAITAILVTFEHCSKMQFIFTKQSNMDILQQTVFLCPRPAASVGESTSSDCHGLAHLSDVMMIPLSKWGERGRKLGFNQSQTQNEAKTLNTVDIQKAHQLVRYPVNHDLCFISHDHLTKLLQNILFRPEFHEFHGFHEFLLR